MDSKRRPFKTVSYKDLLTINNENVFLGYFVRNCGLNMEIIVFENSMNSTLLCKLNNKIIKSKTQCR